MIGRNLLAEPWFIATARTGLQSGRSLDPTGGVKDFPKSLEGVTWL
jgi:hypothetical protein